MIQFSAREAKYRSITSERRTGHVIFRGKMPPQRLRPINKLNNCFQETAALQKSIKVPNDALQILLMDTHSIRSGLAFDFNVP